MKPSNTTAIQAMDDLKSRALLPEGLSLIKFSVSSCTFRRKLRFNEIGLKKDVERTLASLGSKKVLSQDKPKAFRTCKERGETLLYKTGIKFSKDIWAVPTGQYSKTLGELQDIQKEALAIKEDIITNLHQYVEEFAQMAESLEAGFGDHVRNAAYRGEYLDEQLQYIVEGAEEMELTLAHKLTASVVEKATSYYELLEKNRVKYNRTTFEVTRNTRSKLEELQSFINGMAFLDTSVAYMGVLIQQYLDTLPDHYSDATPENNKGLIQLLVNLMNPEKVRLLAENQEDKPDTGVVNTVKAAPVNQVKQQVNAPVANNVVKQVVKPATSTPKPTPVKAEDAKLTSVITEAEEFDLSKFGFEFT